MKAKLIKALEAIGETEAAELVAGMKIYSVKGRDLPCDILLYGFDWAKSDHGYAYWAKIYDKLGAI
jgi:hypothetical protein